MLFEHFHISLIYRDSICDLEIREAFNHQDSRGWDIAQGEIVILNIQYANNTWDWTLTEGLHPIVKQDTESFVSKELISLLIQAIKTHYDFFSERKILNKTQ